MADITFINGKFLPRSQASIPIDDRGFRFGDGVFETIHIRDGKPYLWSQHERRLHEGLLALQISLDVTDNLSETCTELLQKNNVDNGILRIAISRGSGSKGYLPTANEPTIIIETMPLADYPYRFSDGDPQNIDDANKPLISLCLSSYTRPPKSCYPVGCKTMQGLSSTLAKMEAEEQDCFDSLQLSSDGLVSECSSANIFWLQGKTFYTPHSSTGCLGGTIRQRLIEQIPYPVKAVRLSLKKLLKADAVIITNSAYLIMPVHTLKDYKTNWNGSEKLAYKCLTLIEQDMVISSSP